MQRALDAVESGELLPRGGAADDDLALQGVGVEGVQRLPEAEQHQVGDVDDLGDGPHAGGDQARLPGQRGVLLAAGGQAGEPGQRVVRAADRVVDAYPAGGADDRCQRPAGRIREAQPEGRGQLAGEPAMRQCVAAVAGDLELEHRVGPAEQRRYVGAERCVTRQHEDAAVVVAEAELAGGADHAVGHTSVRLAGTNGEAAGQHDARQRDGHPITDREVGRPADDAAGLPRIGDLHLAEPDRLLEAGELLEGAHLADDDTVDRGLARAERLDDLDLETGVGEGIAAGRGVGQAGDELPKPGMDGAHYRTFPPAKGPAKRTSPSSSTRMSDKPCRAMTVRSRPMPNAKPV